MGYFVLPVILVLCLSKQGKYNKISAKNTMQSRQLPVGLLIGHFRLRVLPKAITLG